jgi:hypothetical protein
MVLQSECFCNLLNFLSLVLTIVNKQINKISHQLQKVSYQELIMCHLQENCFKIAGSRIYMGQT